jgi:anti-anti-sigma factor
LNVYVASGLRQESPVGLYDLPSVTIEKGWNASTSHLLDPSQHEVIVRLEGEFDASNSEKLLEQLEVLVADNEVDLTLDMSGVGFFSASTLGVIVQLSEKFHGRNRRLILASPSPEVQRVFGACGLGALLNSSSSNNAVGTLERMQANPARTDRERVSKPALASWVPVPKEDAVTDGRARHSANEARRDNERSESLCVRGSASAAGSFETNPVGRGWL